jgi:hypothetical protein
VTQAVEWGQKEAQKLKLRFDLYHVILIGESSALPFS